MDTTIRTQRVAEFDARQMRNFEQMVSAGVTLGVPAALYYCIEHRLEAPSWLLCEALGLLCDLLKRETSHQARAICGRHCSIPAGLGRYDSSERGDRAS
jgi:hypothetical protein